MLALALILSAFAANAEAALPRIQPNLGEKTCFAREYNEEHMRSNPKQNVSKLHVLLNRQKSEYDRDGTMTSVKVVGEKDGVLYGNEATCEAKAGGTVFCFIECDGGSFNLKHGRKGRVNFEITKDYYFPLYRKGADPENARDEDTLGFSSDRDNGVYSLEVKDAGVCEQQWQKYIAVPEFGC